MQFKRKLQIIPTKNMSRDEWLAERRKAIGGSDAAAIIGLTPYATRYTVWADKTGKLPEREDNEAMRQGRDFEQYVADRFTELTSKKTRRVNAIIKNPDYPFAAANIDRAVNGEASGLECKTTSVLNLRRFRDGEFPESYYCQCVHYLAVTELDRWYLAVLILNKGFMVYRLTRIKDDPLPEWCTASLYVSDDEISALMGAEREFWAMVESDAPPELSGTAPDSDALEAVYSASVSNDSSILLYGHDETIRRYLALKEQIKMLDIEAEQCKQVLQDDLGENESGRTSGYNVLWKTQTRSSFDTKSFARDNPHIDLSKYFKISNFRKFDVKPIKI